MSSGFGYGRLFSSASALRFYWNGATRSTLRPDWRNIPIALINLPEREQTAQACAIGSNSCKRLICFHADFPSEQNRSAFCPLHFRPPSGKAAIADLYRWWGSTVQTENSDQRNNE